MGEKARKIQRKNKRVKYEVECREAVKTWQRRDAENKRKYVT